MTISIPTGATVFTLAGAFGLPQSLNEMLLGEITSANTVVPVYYWNITLDYINTQPQADQLDTQITQTSGMKIVFAHSLGAIVANRWLISHGPTSAVSPTELMFVLIGDAVNPLGGLLYAESLAAPDDTRYTVYNIIRQYDGWADVAKGPNGNITALLNEIAGENNVHPAYQNVDINDSRNVTYTTGHITYVYSPTYPVPLLGQTLQQPPAMQFTTRISGRNFTKVGIYPGPLQTVPGGVFDFSVAPSEPISSLLTLDKGLRPTIESAYDRPVTVPTPY